MQPRSYDPAADLADCRQTLRQGSRTFWAASLLMPRAVREPATALYAFCRCADDVIDERGGGEAAVDWLRARLDRAYAGRPRQHPVDRAFAHAVEAFALPRALPEALIEGMAWDTAGRRYDTISDLRAYAARVAGTVGAMMTVLMGARDAATVARACDLGVAMQLSNIARDVGEDARAGRIYLPLRWMREAGIDPDAWLADPVAGPELLTVVDRLLAEAEGLYDRAAAGITRLPLSCRPGIQAARLMYREIGREAGRLGADLLDRRAVVPGRRKAALVVAALGAAARPSGAVTAHLLEEVRFLVDAVAGHPLEPALQDLRGLGGTIRLFERLERWDQAGRPGQRRGREVVRRLKRA